MVDRGLSDGGLSFLFSQISEDLAGSHDAGLKFLVGSAIDFFSTFAAIRVNQSDRLVADKK